MKKDIFSNFWAVLGQDDAASVKEEKSILRCVCSMVGQYLVMRPASTYREGIESD